MTNAIYSTFYKNRSHRIVVAGVHFPEIGELRVGIFIVKNDSRLTPKKALPQAVINARNAKVNKVFVAEVPPTQEDFMLIADTLGPDMLRRYRG